MGYLVRTTDERDWELYRDIRFEMLRDSPSAFATTLDEALARDEDFWRQRAGSRESVTVVAFDDSTRTVVGCMSSFVDADRDEPAPLLVAVYVAPAHRGHGVADALLDRIEEWARNRGEWLYLEVHDLNEGALRFYRRRGFELTGASRPHPRDGGNEVEMRLRLR